MEFCVPWPNPNMAITEAMPMMIPSMVSSERVLLFAIAFRAILNRFVIFIFILFYSFLLTIEN